MLTIELDHQTVAELIDLIKRQPPASMHLQQLLDDARLTLQDAYDNAAEEYWTTKWSGEQ
jgi:hypothetical protein